LVLSKISFAPIDFSVSLTLPKHLHILLPEWLHEELSRFRPPTWEERFGFAVPPDLKPIQVDNRIVEQHNKAYPEQP
jgi:hypothetical protein